MTLGQKIKYWRQVAALTQEEFAFRAGVSPDTLRQIERDRREPKEKTLKKIASALHLKVEELSAEFAQKSAPKPKSVIKERPSTVGKNIARLRKEKNMTLEQLGKLLGMSRQRVHQLETYVKYHAPETLENLARALGVNVEQLLEE